MRKTILIRADGIVPSKGGYIPGIGRSTIELIKGLERLQDSDLHFEIYAEHARHPLYSGKEWKFKYHRYLLPHLFSHIVNVETLWRRLVCKHDLVHLTGENGQASNKEKFVVTIHDLRSFHDGRNPPGKYWQFAKYSRGIATCSTYTKDDIVRSFGVPADKVAVIPWGIRHDIFYPRSEERIRSVTARLGIKGRYFFSCSCNLPHKNTDYVLAAFRQFIRENNDCTMVFTWSNPKKEFTREYAKEIAEGRIKFLKFVSDEELATLYSGALASIFVSSFEGFGFPILESMACGTPCVTCRNTSLEEVGQDKAYYVKEKDADAITDAMFHFAKYGKGDKEALTSYAKGFSWDNTARQYIDFYKKNLY